MDSLPDSWIIESDAATKPQRRTLHALLSRPDEIIAVVSREEASTLIQVCGAALSRWHDEPTD